MNRSKSPPLIQGDVLKAVRKEQGLTIASVAEQTCLSERQVRQIENGEKGSFYSEGIKLAAARKVAKVLNLEDQAWIEVPSKERLSEDSNTAVEAQPDIAAQSSISSSLASIKAWIKHLIK